MAHHSSIKSPLLPTTTPSTIDENINNNDKTVYNAITFYQKMVPRDPHEINRTATPLELLFDLTLVVSISITSEQFTHMVLEGFNIDLAIFLFFATFSSNWMAWMDFTWFLTAYDPDDVFFRIGTLGQILGILTIGTGVPPAFMFNFTQVLYGFILLRAFYVSFYLGRAAFEDSVNRVYNLRMIFLTILVQAGWYITSVYGPPTIEWTASTFVVLMFCEFFFPYISEIATPSPGRHPIHLGERYGALTIIVIGESFISLGAAVIDTTTGSISPEACKIAVACVVTLFVMWWTYFTIPFGVLMQTRRNLMRVCGYGHYFLHISIAIAASGTSLMMQTGLYPEKHFFGREVAVQVFAWAVSAYFVFLTLVTGVLLGFCRVFFMGLGIKVGTCAVFLAIAHFGTPHLGTGDTLLIMCIPIILLLCATIWITNRSNFAANTEADAESP